MTRKPIYCPRPGFTALLLALLAITVLLPRVVRGDDWPHWLGPERNGVCAEKGWLKKWPAAGPPRLWEQNIGSGYSSIIISGGRLILFHRVADTLHVDSLKAATGKRHPSRITARYGCTEDGRLRALRFHADFKTGAHPCS